MRLDPPTDVTIYLNGTANRVRQTSSNGVVTVAFAGAKYSSGGIGYIAFTGAPLTATQAYDFDLVVNCEL